MAKKTVRLESAKLRALKYTLVATQAATLGTLALIASPFVTSPFLTAGLAAVVAGGIKIITHAADTSPRKIEAMFLRYGAILIRPDTTISAYARIHEDLRELSSKAGLKKTPALYIARAAVGALSLHSPWQSAILIENDMARTATRAEIRGILAHELTHILRKDSYQCYRNNTVGFLSVLAAGAFMICGAFVPGLQALALAAGSYMLSKIDVRRHELIADRAIAVLTPESLPDMQTGLLHARTYPAALYAQTLKQSSPLMHAYVTALNLVASHPPHDIRMAEFAKLEQAIQKKTDKVKAQSSRAPFKAVIKR